VNLCAYVSSVVHKGLSQFRYRLYSDSQ
jgi:hypothetical protein